VELVNRRNEIRGVYVT